MRKILGIIVLGLLINTSLNAKQLSKSPFIPDNVQDEFNKLSTEHKIKLCGFENYKTRKAIINKDLDGVSFNGPWLHIIQYRYPNHRTSKFLKSKMTNRARSLKSDEVMSIGVGCIYNALANK